MLEVSTCYLLRQQNVLIDNLQEGAWAEVHVEFLNSAGNLVGYTTSPRFTYANAVGGYFKFQTVAVAPEETASVRLANFLFPTCL